MSDQVEPGAAAAAARRRVRGDPAGRRAGQLHASGHDGESPAASGLSLQHRGS